MLFSSRKEFFMAVKTNYIKNGYKYYRLTRTIGKKLDGTTIKKEFFGKNKSEAEIKADEYLKMVKRGLPFDFEEITIEKLMDSWLFNTLNNSKDFKSSSFERYEGIYRNYIKNTNLGYLKVYNINTTLIQQYYNSLYEKGKNYSQIGNLNKLLKKFFYYCMDNDFILKNPCSNRLIKIPGNADLYENEEEEDNTISVFTEEELQSIINNLNFDKTISLAIFLAILTGLRMGEILALKSKYLDLDSKLLKVKFTASKVKVFDDNINTHYEMQLQKPKTKSSIRSINIPSESIYIFEKYIELQKKKYEKFNLTFDEESLIFSSTNCKIIDKSNFRKSWERFLDDANIKYKKFHALRHTFATILFKKGASILEVKELLGHASSKTTEKIYIYVFPESKEKAINKLNYLVPSETQSGNSREIVRKQKHYIIKNVVFLTFWCS
jgi:integrase